MTPADSAACGFDFVNGESYLVYAAERDGHLSVSSCSRTRKMSEAAVRDLVAQHTSGRTLGFIGEPYVRVLELNMALDATANP